jgi:hypothetical protein
VIAWLQAQDPAWRAAITHVSMDTSATYARAARIALPHAMVVVDRFHLVQLANQALTEYRRELTRATRGRRGRKADPEWAQRNRLLRAGETLTAEEATKMHDAMRTADPSGGLEKCWQAKELLRKPARVGPRRRTGSQPDLASADRFLHALRGLRDRPAPAAGVDRERVAALRHRRPDHRHQQRPHRGPQQNRQARRQGRLRIQEQQQPETPDTLPPAPASRRAPTRTLKPCSLGRAVLSRGWNAITPFV